ncbi:hypothetical protein [Rathayibacter festucae]|uniref:hypothetical protein n=1 Tax=Rathayibacter festucae TaxID=110937 RepID=UPI002A6B6DE4|nr:hypothetical protein [Rathayibacter festucae]MDY0912312.1 hypothetical protein [Rathayibacter festucae]
MVDKGEGPVLCLGVVGESFIPVCDGPPVTGWDWNAVDQNEASGGTRWGSYDVVGSWDGSHFTLTERPVPAAPATDDAYRPDGGDAADHSPEVVATAVADYTAELDERGGVLSVTELDGRARVLVVFDDGTLQADADARYGGDVVVIESRLERVDQS